MISLLFTITLLPALLTLTKLQPKPKQASQKMDELMSILALFPIYYHKAILVGSTILILVALLTISKIELSHNPLYWLQDGDENRVSTEVIDKKIHGSVTIEATIDTGKENGWIDSVRLQKLDSVSKRIERYVGKSKVVSLATIIKETNMALHENKESYYSIPDSKGLISKELSLFEISGSDDLEDVLNSKFSKTRVTIKLPWIDALKRDRVLQYIKEELERTFAKEKVETTGMIPLYIYIISNTIDSLILSYAIAFILITGMMILILYSVPMGLFSMISNIMPIIMGLLVIYLLNIPLDIFTLLVGTIAIGLAVVGTIHFSYNFRRYYLENYNIHKSIEMTFLTTGKAMVITVIVLSLGFYTFMIAQTTSVQNFGFLTGTVIIFALLSILLLAPALMMLVAKRGWIK
jgi:predicted RND superfamily exporter protein